MTADDLEALARRIEELDTFGQGDWDEGYASGLRTAAKLVRELAKTVSA